jgi:uncharacterized damage-inducible protein DinB
MSPIGRPEPTEYHPDGLRYVGLVPGNDIVHTFSRQIDDSLARLRLVSAEDSLRRYAPGKWSVREVVGHMIDAERIFAYRALRFARSDETALPGFDENTYTPAARSDERAWPDLLAELELVRRGHVLMFDGLPVEAWHRRGIANGKEMTVRALAYNIAGHELHHMKVLQERYLSR